MKQKNQFQIVLGWNVKTDFNGQFHRLKDSNFIQKKLKKKKEQ